MAKLVLTQIMKNEAHVITRMLNSIKPVVDIICLVDTGSTDNTIEVVKNWGQENGIETHVFERPFDNFENSRNYSIQMAREVTQGRGNDFWGFWLDADEVLEIQPHFNKNAINKDLYMFNTYINVMKYTRNECYKLDKPFRFYGPVHEFIVCDEKNLTSGLMDGLIVRVQMDGGSWKGNIPEKYKSHAFVLEKYIDANRQDPRWIFYTAQSYHDSACMPDNREENEERLRRSMKYYRERISRMDGYPEEIFYSQFRVGTIMRTLEEPWSNTLNEFLKAYSIDPLRAEPIKAIVDYYLHVGEWNNAYLFSKFLKVNFHGKNPYPQRLLFVDEALYLWKILEVHAASCFYTNRKDEAKQSFQELIKISREQPQFFSPEDLNKIQMNSQFFV
jgi:glycosyltransferase involved in cell wall biosynthesis